MVRHEGTWALDLFGTFLFFWWHAATQIAFLVTFSLSLLVQQERTQVVCGNKEAWKRLADSNRTSTMDLELVTDHIRRYCGVCV